MTEASAGFGWLGIDPPGVRALIMPLVLARLLTVELMEVEAILSIYDNTLKSKFGAFTRNLTKRSWARGGGGTLCMGSRAEVGAGAGGINPDPTSS